MKLIPQMKTNILILSLLTFTAFAQPPPPLPPTPSKPAVITNDARTKIVYSVAIETNMIYREPDKHIPTRSPVMSFPQTNVIVEHWEVSSNNLMHVVFDGQKSHIAKNSTVLRKYKVTTTNIVTAVTNSSSQETPE